MTGSERVGNFVETLGTCVARTLSSSATPGVTDTIYEFWEVGGRYAAKFPYAVTEQLHDADVIVHVFSFSDRASLLSASKDLAKFREVKDNVPVILVGTKRDCISTCQLSLEDAQGVAADCGVSLVLVDSPHVEPEEGGKREGDVAVALLLDALKVARERKKL